MKQFVNRSGCTYDCVDSGNGILTISAKCIVTKEVYQVVVPMEALEAWLKGADIQKCMPQLSAGGREFLISQISPKGWEQTFGADEE